MNMITRIARKELAAFFGSPVAFIFLGCFLAVTLFTFFWVETFFAANLAELRALFTWMPILMIFLTSAITMRSWSEERRSGTMELLLTSPVSPVSLVAGKFLACLALVCVALALTLPLPITVSMLGPLDWGPVFGGYLATIFLAGAYISIGLYVSVKSDNQIVSLIVSTIVCTLFYLIGSDLIVSFFGNRGAEILKLFGTGSRFSSITRGVIDLRDIAYYISIIGIFLTLNTYGLEKLRWANNPARQRHRSWQIASVLVIANFIALSAWLTPVGSLRADLTQGAIYSISDTTRAYLQQLKEPLLIRGYFSPQTHPLLAPLVPRLRDLLREYAVVGGDKVRVEFVNPLDNPELEQEAGQRYGIRPVPFQTASKYQSSVTNSYFNILVAYGDQFEVLGFRDLIEVKTRGEQDFDVDLRNPEYDITRAVKKVLYGFQGGGDPFAAIKKPVTFTGYISPDLALPEELASLKKELLDQLETLKQKSGGRFSVEFVDPDGGNGDVAQRIRDQYGFRPMSLNLFDTHSFWFYMTLTSGEQVVEVPLPEDLNGQSLKRALDAGLKRFAGGMTKTVALHAPTPPPPQLAQFMPEPAKQFSLLKSVIDQEHNVVDTDLKTGRVPEEADLLLITGPDDLDDKQLFAVDQFLMQGGTVIIADSPFSIGLQGALSARKQSSRLGDWLRYYGLNIEEQLVLDPQNSSFPVPVERNVGGYTVQETHLVSYPYFVDIRPDGMNPESGITGGLNQVTMNWVSPINVDHQKNRDRTVTELLHSSERSWTSEKTGIQPDYRNYPELGFKPGDQQGRRLLAVSVEGSFPSYFEDKPSPLLEKKDNSDTEKPTGADGQENQQEPRTVINRQIEKSPNSARIILFASQSFLDDTILGIGSSMMGTNYLSPLQLVANSVDWSLEDRGLLSIRGRSHFARTLVPLPRDAQLFWEYLNYGLALTGLVLIWLIKVVAARHRRARHLALINEHTGRI